MFAWSYLGMISSTEGVVFLSDIVLGVVYERRVVTLGLKTYGHVLLSCIV
jgi:hypothetical protein